MRQVYALGEMYRTLDQMDFALWCFERAAGFGHYNAQKNAKKMKRKKAKPVAPF